VTSVTVFADLGVGTVVVVLLRVGETAAEVGDFFRRLAGRLTVTVGIAFEDVEVVLDDVVLLCEKGVAITGAVLNVFFSTRPLRV
jgi:hypothetical protein